MRPLLLTIAILPLVVFWLWMFWHMLTNPLVSDNLRLYWTIGFVLVGFLTALYYYFTEYQKS